MALPPQGPTTEGELPVGAIVSQKYRVERLLGHGGMGNVYLALHTQLGRRVALKTLRAQALAMADLRARFRREAMAAAALTSEHIVQVIDLGELPDGSPFMVMEFLEGQDLAAMLQQRGPLPVAEVIDLLRQACAGLAVAHAAGIVHRDLKPANLFAVPRPGSTPLLKVLDFGIAKAPLLVSSIHTQVPLGPHAARTDLTRTDAVLGSLRYMAPEQMASARDVDARADLWSLGVIAYKLLTGQPPFAGEQLHEIYMEATRSRPQPLAQLRPDAPPALAQIIDTCLQPEPGHRWPSAVALQLALGSVLAPSSAPATVIDPRGHSLTASQGFTVAGPQGHTVAAGPHGHTQTASPGLTMADPQDAVGPMPLPAPMAAPRSRFPLVAAVVAGGLTLVGSVGLALVVARKNMEHLVPVVSPPVSAPVVPSATGSSLDSLLPPAAVPLPVADVHRVDPLELMALARARAIAIEPTSTLHEINIANVKSGRVDLVDPDSHISFHFRFTPRSSQAVNVLFWDSRLHRASRGTYGSERFASVSTEPRCSLAQAWDALVRAGKTPPEGASAHYTRVYAGHETWRITLPESAGGDHLVNGQTCAVEGPTSKAPGSAFNPPPTWPAANAPPAPNVRPGATGRGKDPFEQPGYR